MGEEEEAGWRGGATRPDARGPEPADPVPEPLKRPFPAAQAVELFPLNIKLDISVVLTNRQNRFAPVIQSTQMFFQGDADYPDVFSTTGL